MDQVGLCEDLAGFCEDRNGFCEDLGGFCEDLGFCEAFRLKSDIASGLDRLESKKEYRHSRVFESELISITVTSGEWFRN